LWIECSLLIEFLIVRLLALNWEILKFLNNLIFDV